jgi:hypothetical protein
MTLNNTNINKFAILIPAKTAFKFILHAENSTGVYRLVPISNLNIYKWGGGNYYGNGVTTLKPMVVSTSEDSYYPTGSSYMFSVDDFKGSGWLNSPSFTKQTISIPIARSDSAKHKGFSVFVHTYPNIFGVTGAAPNTKIDFPTSTTGAGGAKRKAWEGVRGSGIALGIIPKLGSLASSYGNSTYVPTDQNADGYISGKLADGDYTGVGGKDLYKNMTMYTSTGMATNNSLKASYIQFNNLNLPGLCTGSSINNEGKYWLINVPAPIAKSVEFNTAELNIQISGELLYLLYLAKNDTNNDFNGTINFNIAIADEKGKCINEFSIPVVVRESVEA